MNKDHDEMAHVTTIALGALFLLLVATYFMDGRQKEQKRFEQCVEQRGQWTKSPNGYACVIEKG